MNVQTSFSYVYNTITNTWVPLASMGSNFPEPFVPSGSVPLIDTAAFNLGFNGTTWEKSRIANVFKVARVSDSSAPQIVWAAPGVGKKIRVMGFTISVGGNQVAVEVIQIDLKEGIAGAAFWSGNATLQATTPSGDTQMGADYGQGRLCTAANTAIYCEISDDILNGDAAISLWGTEE